MRIKKYNNCDIKKLIKKRFTKEILLVGFVVNIDITFFHNVERTCAMNYIDIDASRCWNHLWLETNCKLVFISYIYYLIVHWSLRNR